MWVPIFGRGRKQQGGTRGPDIAIPFFGYKSHLSIDRRWRFIRRWTVASAADHDGRLLRRDLIDPTNTASGLWADSAYRSRKNEDFLKGLGLVSYIHRRRTPGKPLAEHVRRGQATRSKHRAPRRARLRLSEDPLRPLPPKRRDRQGQDQNQPRQHPPRHQQADHPPKGRRLKPRGQPAERAPKTRFKRRRRTEKRRPGRPRTDADSPTQPETRPKIG